MKKFEEMRKSLQEEMERRFQEIQIKEKREREKRITPLVSRYTSLMEDVVRKAAEQHIDSLEKMNFKKAEARQRLAAFMAEEIAQIAEMDTHPDLDGDVGDTESKPSSRPRKTVERVPEAPETDSVSRITEEKQNPTVTDDGAV